MHAQQARQPTEKPFPLLVAWLVGPGWLASSRRICQGGRPPTHKADCWITKNMFQGPTLGSKIESFFLLIFRFFFDFWDRLLDPETGTKNWSRIWPSLRNLIARAPGDQFLVPVFGPRFGPTFHFFFGEICAFLGVIRVLCLAGPRPCCKELRR